MSQQHDEPTPEMYLRVFEDNPAGAAILQHLISRFSRPAVTKGGIDAVLQTYYNNGASQVLTFITMKIEQANGVQHDDPEGD